MAHSLGSDTRIDPDELWLRLRDGFQELFHCHQITLRSTVLMSNHLHGLAENTVNAESKILRLLTSVTEISPSHFDFVPMSTFNQYLHAYKYVYRNPVEAGLCNQVEDFEHSTVRSAMGQSKTHWPVFDNMNLASDPRRVLMWLNDLEPLYFQTAQRITS